MIINRKYDTTHVSTWEFSGKSTETKPMVRNGSRDVPPDQSLFLEVDTAEVYYYDKDTDNWYPLGES